MILFIGHEASLTGAPVLLLNTIKQIKAKTNWEIEVILRKGGDLLPDYQAVAKTQVWQLPEFGNPSFLWKIKNKLFKNFAKKRKTYINQFANKNVQLIFSSTCTNGELLEQLSYLKCPIVAHVHELETVIQMFNTNNLVDQSLNLCAKIFTGSKAVQENLIENHGISRKKTELIYSATPTEIDKNLLNLDVRKKLNIAETDFLAVACGTLENRKGYDLFIQVAYEILHRQKIKNIHFVWVGSTSYQPILYQIDKELKLMQLTDYVHFIGKEKVTPYLKSMDLMLMTSREDPFPLVNLEAGMLKKTVICFENSGGTPELLAENCGFTVPYLNILDMANKIIELKENPALLQKTGENLYQKVQKNFTIDHISDQIIDQIKKIIK
ncbi:MAG: glycosyltransferase [Bacteroidetes bacterium]|nr:MAG: glycosyltransferase [Bacteroidota bacterium]